VKLIELSDLYLLCVAGLAVIAGWPIPGLRWLIANSVSSAAYILSPQRRRVIETNLIRYFNTELSHIQRKQITKQVFDCFWQDFFLWHTVRSRQEILGTVEIHNLDRLHTALAQGKGIILLESSFFGNRAITKQIFHANGIEIHQIHSETHLAGLRSSSTSLVRHKFVRPFFDRCEKKYVSEIINLPTSDSLSHTRHMAGLLQQNKIICASGDGQNGQRLMTVFFMGQTRAFTTGIINLSRLSGAPLLPIFCVNGADGKTHLFIESALSLKIGSNREQQIENGLNQYARLLEGYIRQYPGHFRNWEFEQRVNKMAHSSTD
jgi:lauroyl/myristoyl acyltransferase